jgi:hypothetical protein
MTRKIQDGGSAKLTWRYCSCGRRIPVRLRLAGACCLDCAKGKPHHNRDCDARGK